MESEARMYRVHRFVMLVAACGIAGCSGEAREPNASPAAERITLMEGLGDLTFPVTTRVAEAQAFFDQGLRLTWAFNHAEAVRSFRAAQQLDSACAMCWWGEAFALGPNINAGMDSASGVAAHEAAVRAAELKGSATPLERALIDALAVRYAHVPPADRAPLDSAWAYAIGAVAQANPDNDEAAVLHADAQMNLSPWDYWVDATTTKPNGAVAIAELERVLARNPQHPGACHLFIHAVEKTQPDRAVACAERLPALMPAAGHIVHMPAHIYIRVGRYADAVERNVHATHADDAILQDLTPDGVYRLGYYPHNHHFLSFAAGMAGMSAQALQSARNTASAVDTSLLRAPELMALQHYAVYPLYAMVRFGRWDDILGWPTPPGDLPYMLGTWHYARALALLHSDRRDEAETALQALRTTRSDPALADAKIWGLNSAAALLEIADDVVTGEFAAARGEWNLAIERLRAAVAREDALTYDEPPTWSIPARHNLGAILLAAGRPADAELVYRADLEVYRENGWSLFGLAQALDAQGRTADAEAVRARFATAWSAGDVTLTGSRF
jgi:tetratricopeptide (TPR) repeat protein